MACGIYMIQNIINGKRYIGQLVNIDKRWYEHTKALEDGNHYNEHLQHSWNQYGKLSFEFSIILECERKDLNEKEIEYIFIYQSNNPDYGYNLTAGGEGTLEISEELKAKRKQSTLQHIKEHPEFIENHRQKTLEQFKDPDFYQKYRELRSSDEFRQKERESHLGLKQSDEAKQKISESFSKPVICVETGVVYKSAREAAKHLPGNKNIQAAANGARKTAGGYHWKYVDAI